MLKELRERVALGLIKEVVHPEYPELSLFNYTQVCQFEKAWDEHTLNARGIVINTETEEVVARPFKKFFNLSEHQPDEIPSSDPYVFEKMDGSLGIVFYYGGEWHIATRGSFTSEQAIWASKVVKNYTASMVVGYTYLVEIIYPNNRIVVNYEGLEDLVYLGEYSKYGEFFFNDNIHWQNPFTYTCRFLGKMGTQELPTEGENQEGFVLWWPDQDVRVKVKFDEYVRLHSILTNYSPKKLFEVLSTGGDIEQFLQGVPDEFYKMVREDELLFKDLWADVCTGISLAQHDYKNLTTRKEQAKVIMNSHKELSKALFAELDGKLTDDIIWKLVWQRYEEVDGRYGDKEGKPVGLAVVVS